MKISEEIIDSFLRGDLSTAEAEAFKNALAADPKLQQEVSVQQDIVETLKAHRHQQLKSRLNSIDVKPVGFFGSSYVKLAASIGLVALLVSTFAVFNSGTEEETAVLTTGETDLSAAENTQITLPAPAAETLSATTTGNNVASKNDAVVTNQSIGAAEKASKKTVQKTVLSSTTTYADVDTEEMDEQFNIHPQTDGVDMSTVNHSSVNSTASQVKVNIVKDKDLAYRFFNNQLYLHGNFSNSPYELYELNNSPSKQLFLYFDGNYYELIQGKTKVTALSPIKDKATLAQLSQLRAH